MKKITKKKITLQDLAFSVDKLSLSVNKGFKRVENLIKEEIDGLAISTAKGFASVDKRFDGLDGKFEGLDKRIDDFVVTRVKYEDFNKLKARVDIIEKK